MIPENIGTISQTDFKKACSMQGRFTMGAIGLNRAQAGATKKSILITDTFMWPWMTLVPPGVRGDPPRTGERRRLQPAQELENYRQGQGCGEDAPALCNCIERFYNARKAMV